MPISVGDALVQAVSVGAAPVQSVYVGADRVWSQSQMYFDFGEVVSNLTTRGWVYGSPAPTYRAMSDGSSLRINMPDGVSVLGEFIDRVRYGDAVAGRDDGYLRFGFKSLGSWPSPSVSHYYTDIFARGSNGGFTDGVGVRAEAGGISILSRISGTEVVRADCGSFDTTDKFLLRFHGDVWTLYRNGEFAGEWDDTGDAAAGGSGYRSLIVRVTGGRELVGARRFSPQVDYIEYG